MGVAESERGSHDVPSPAVPPAAFDVRRTKGPEVREVRRGAVPSTAETRADDHGRGAAGQGGGGCRPAAGVRLPQAIDHSDGICDMCNSNVPTLLAPGSRLTVVPPSDAVPIPYWYSQPKTFTGNSKIVGQP